MKRIVISLVVCIQLLISSNAWSTSQGIGRIRQCDAAGTCEGLDFNPTMGGKDAQFVLSNPVCLSVTAAGYLSVKGAIYTMNRACGRPKPMRWFPSLLTDLSDIGSSGLACGPSNPACCAAVTVAIGSFGSFLGYLRAIYDAAVDAYKESRFCGYEWFMADPDSKSLTRLRDRIIPEGEMTVPNVDEIGGKEDVDTIKEIVKKCRGSNSSGDGEFDQFCSRMLTIQNKHYREYFFGGVEVYDNPVEGEEICYDPYVRNGVGYQRQKYYMKGNEEGIFNCDRYNANQLTADPLTGEAFDEERKQAFESAYNCCKNRAENYACINYKGQRKFCRANSKCTMTSGAKFATFSTESQKNGSRICVETYNFCPYNFFLNGGSEVCDYYQDNTNISLDRIKSGNCGNLSEVRNPDCKFNSNAGKCKNYCQYNVHCVKTSKIYTHKISDASPYMSTACINFVGDSRNRLGLGGDQSAVQYMTVSKRHFSAPIVQCFKETIENIFHNRAGHTRCLVDHEERGVDISGHCPGGYLYEEGDSVFEQSFFERFQETINIVIRIALTLAITFYGVKILIASGEIKKKDMMMLIVKIALVMYFATGSAWKDVFFDGVYRASDFFSTLVFKIQIPEYEDERDGCQFGRVYTSIEAGSERSTIASGYPEGKEYLAIWDTLDCKLARYLGFGHNFEVASIASIFVAGWLIGPIGTYIVSIFFVFTFLIISVVIRAVHIFLASTVAIILLIFISPITIACIMTEKTKDIFTSWLKQLISFALQPMILCIYLAILVSILDVSLKGRASYEGDAPAKIINCHEFCAEEDGTYARNGAAIISTDDPLCAENNRQIIDPKAESLECIISVNEYSMFPGLSLIGIYIPFIVEFLLDKPVTRMTTIVRSVIVIYFLYKFLDEVPSIASQLLGGASLPMSRISGLDMFKTFHKKLKGTSKRAGRGIGKIAGGIKDKAGRAIQSRRPQKADGEKSSGGESENSAPRSGPGGG